jgi:hypothetical protein
MTGHATNIKGYRLKDGRLVKSNKHLDVSARLRQRGSKKITVKRKGA